MVNKKSQIHFQWLFRIILFMTVTFLIITSLNWKVEAVTENPNGRNKLSCTLAAKMDPLITPLATKLVIQQSSPIADF